MVTLATYLPFYRLHEVADYFLSNLDIVKAKRSLVYVDNVYTQRQLEVLKKVLPPEVEFRVGNWRSRGGAWLAILKDHREWGGELLVVDSDNILSENFHEIHRCLSRYNIYTVLDLPSGDIADNIFVKRSGVVESDCKYYKFKVYRGGFLALFRGGPVFFIGPKQAVYFKSPLDASVLERVEKAFESTDAVLRQFISDETVLGVLAYFSGVKEVPWAFASRHYWHGSTPGRAIKHIDALARYQFAKYLHREFRRPETFKFMVKYLLAYYKNFIIMR